MANKEKKFTSIGGQALMEGIMMRGPHKTSMCVRRANGEKVLEIFPTKEKKLYNKIPIVRGVVSFAESMIDGTKMLMRSAEMTLEDIAEEEKNSAPEVKEAANENAETAELIPAEPTPDTVPERKVKKEKKEEELSDWMLIVSAIFGVGLAALLFIFLPTWIYNGLLLILPDSAAAALESFELWRSLIEGVIKIGLFLAYVSLCSLMKDIYRVFQYHGAEHKSIFCYENGLELTVENVRKQSRFHPRCGTSFLIIMLIISILSGILISCVLPSADESWWIRPLIKLALIPLVMGVGYELLKLAGRYDNILTRIISAPGKWMQRITTKEPDDKMIECAIEALKAVIPENEEDDRW